MQIKINKFIQKNLKKLTNKTFSKKYISLKGMSQNISRDFIKEMKK